MELASARRVDYYLGLPLCLLLSGLLWLRERLLPRRSPDGPRAFLFVELAEMGSTILATPAIAELRRRHPDARFCFAILEKNRASLAVLGLFDEDDVCAIRDGSLLEMAVDVVRFARFCRRRRVDTVVDLELFARISSLLYMLSGARTRAGFHNYRGEGLYRGEHLTHPVHYNPYLHMSQNFLAMIDALRDERGAVPGPKRRVARPEAVVKAPVDPESFAFVEAELARDFVRAPEHRIVVVNHEAGQVLPLRSWPIERFAELSARLIEDDPYVIVVLIGIEEARKGAGWIAKTVGSPRCIDFVGRTRSVQDVVQLFHQADLLITNDSGPAHFASLTDIRTVALFGPETPALYGPLGDGVVSLHEPLACSPCLTAANHRNSPCVDNLCMQAIPVERVLSHARRLLESSNCAASGNGVR